MRELVQKLRKRYRVIAFSGSIRERIDYLNKRYGLKQDFDDLILSFNFGFTKKEIEFYKILIKRIKCKPEECVLIDDSPIVLEIAKSFKIKTILFKNLKQLEFDLKNLKII
jgi:HAD superfamily hydrolase (TIGR01509 family)